MKKLELTARIKCGKCHACLVYDSDANDNVFDDRGWPVLMNMKIVCEICNENGCPKAKDHLLTCKMEKL